ncbi:YopX family protein [Streptococcus sp. S784/96/1]|uniref:YopX family protein n=1 Tax=Streptococcus sp. S784/96/1 TaxID=2653499 RepID=UPI0013897662|nr:YopX family protein [Streptococcus sp. S784/96/1]
MIPRFRAWDKANQKMVEGNRILIWGDSFFILDEGYDWNINDLSGSEIDEKYAMQSIERKDINDIDIFCDDIVKDFQGNLFQVKYWQEYSSYFLSPVEEPNKPMGLYPDIALEVIGNIYENPELFGG